jgi:hypothetical protein
MDRLSKDCDEEEEGKNCPDTQFSSFMSISVHHVDSGGDFLPQIKE